MVAPKYALLFQAEALRVSWIFTQSAYAWILVKRLTSVQRQLAKKVIGTT